MLNGVAFCQMIYLDGRPYDYRYLYTNPAFHRQTGQGEVAGKLASELRPGLQKSDQELLTIYGRVARNGEPEAFEMYIPSFGEWLSISVYCPLPDHFVALFDVITQRKRGEFALEERATQLRFVLEGSELGFWDWNLSTGRVERNARWAQMLGYTYEEIQTTAQQWSDFIHPDDRDRAWASIHAVVEGRAAAHKEEYRMRCKDGSHRWILDQAKVMDTPFFYGQESPEAVAYHQTAAALSSFSKTGLTDIEDVVPFIRHLVSEGWWMTGQTLLINGGYTTK